MTLAQQVHTELAFIGITTIQRPLPDASGHGNLMHADDVGALLGEEVPRDLQDTPAMLHCVTPFGPRTWHKWLRQARRPRENTRFFHHCSFPLDKWTFVRYNIS